MPEKAANRAQAISFALIIAFAFLPYLRAQQRPAFRTNTELVQTDVVVFDRQERRPSRLRIESATDLARIPYLAELNLEGMASGPYVLQVTAIDRTAQSTTSQRMTFEIE